MVSWSKFNALQRDPAPSVVNLVVHLSVSTKIDGAIFALVDRLPASATRAL
jgi:hypothetical protein